MSGIQGYVRDSLLVATPRHIEGHQDDLINMTFLDWWEMLNVVMDIWWEHCRPTVLYFHYKIPKGMRKIKLIGNCVVNHLVQYLTESIEGGVIAEYWITKKKKFSDKSFFKVNWKAVKRAMATVTRSCRIWVSKFESGI